MREREIERERVVRQRREKHRRVEREGVQGIKMLEWESRKDRGNSDTDNCNRPLL